MVDDLMMEKRAIDQSIRSLELRWPCKCAARESKSWESGRFMRENMSVESWVCMVLKTSPFCIGGIVVVIL
jgi:hypothetical protein